MFIHHMIHMMYIYIICMYIYYILYTIYYILYIIYYIYIIHINRTHGDSPMVFGTVDPGAELQLIGWSRGDGLARRLPLRRAGDGGWMVHPFPLGFYKIYNDLFHIPKGIFMEYKS